MSPAARRIAELNDAFRAAGIAGGDWFLTDGVQSRGPAFALGAIQAVRRFDDFSPGNDPYGERDFGSFQIGEHRLFWKIDYYDRSLTHGSAAPGDPAQTRRVLTIMLAEEY